MAVITLSTWTRDGIQIYQVLLNGNPIISENLCKGYAVKIWEETYTASGSAKLQQFNGDTGEVEVWDQK